MNLNDFLKSDHFVGVNNLPNEPSIKYQKMLYIAKDSVSNTIKIGWTKGKRELNKSNKDSKWKFIWSWTLPSPSMVELKVKRQLSNFATSKIEYDTDFTYEQFSNIDEFTLIHLVRLNILAVCYETGFLEKTEKLHKLSQRLNIDSVDEVRMNDMKWVCAYDYRKIEKYPQMDYEVMEILDRKKELTNVFYLAKIKEEVQSGKSYWFTMNDQRLFGQATVRNAPSETNNIAFNVGDRVIVRWEGSSSEENLMRGKVIGKLDKRLKLDGRTVSGHRIAFDGPWANENVPLGWMEHDDEEEDIGRGDVFMKYKEGKKEKIIKVDNEDIDSYHLYWLDSNEAEPYKEQINAFMEGKTVLYKGVPTKIKTTNIYGSFIVNNKSVSDNKIGEILNTNTRINVSKLYDIMDIEPNIENLWKDVYDYEDTVEASVHSVSQIDGVWDIVLLVNGERMRLSKNSKWFDYIVEYRDDLVERRVQENSDIETEENEENEDEQNEDEQNEQQYSEPEETKEDDLGELQQGNKRRRGKMKRTISVPT